MQKLFEINQQKNWILGVWVRSEFETDLPSMGGKNGKFRCRMLKIDITA
jgi:hypothetical protein